MISFVINFFCKYIVTIIKNDLTVNYLWFKSKYIIHNCPREKCHYNSSSNFPTGLEQILKLSSANLYLEMLIQRYTKRGNFKTAFKSIEWKNFKYLNIRPVNNRGTPKNECLIALRQGNCQWKENCRRRWRNVRLYKQRILSNSNKGFPPSQIASKRCDLGI